MIEVEAKVKVSDPSYFRALAVKLGKYKGTELKVDDYYSLEKGYPEKSLRIRHRNGKYEVNFKKSISYRDGIHAKKEVEFKVAEIHDFILLITNFGFKRWLRKEKESEIYEINKNFHIEINHVKKLGWFVEVEYLCDVQHIDKARACVKEAMRFMGFKPGNFIKEGYTKLLWKKK
jgi:adenylate cyclase class 2